VKENTPSSNGASAAVAFRLTDGGGVFVAHAFDGVTIGKGIRADQLPTTCLVDFVSAEETLPVSGFIAGPKTLAETGCPPRGLPPMSCRICAISQIQLSNRYVKTGMRSAKTRYGCGVRDGRSGSKTLSAMGQKGEPGERDGYVHNSPQQ
jgi:hypothetical protein